MCGCGWWSSCVPVQWSRPPMGALMGRSAQPAPVAHFLRNSFWGPVGDRARRAATDAANVDVVWLLCVTRRLAVRLVGSGSQPVGASVVEFPCTGIGFGGDHRVGAVGAALRGYQIHPPITTNPVVSPGFRDGDGAPPLMMIPTVLPGSPVSGGRSSG